ncbi:MAG: hypothetical protein L6R30_11970 [Thermoanaerobaculia bacterium]|nr:hypothetical protein [Thermoanaerobaculia bacterium]
MTQRRRPNDNPGSPFFGLAETDFEDLPPLVKKRIVRLLAHVSEKSYRRGVQHGVELRNRITRDIPRWRMGPVSRSPEIDSNRTLSSVEMLFRELGLSLTRYGFEEPGSRPRKP